MLIKFSLRESDLYIDAQSPLSWMGIHITRKFVSVKILQPLPQTPWIRYSGDETTCLWFVKASWWFWSTKSPEMLIDLQQD